MHKLLLMCGMLVSTQMIISAAVYGDARVSHSGQIQPKYRDHCVSQENERLRKCCPPQLEGPTGATGATGATGRQGLRGQRGERGKKGEKGSKGERGEKGDKGCRGEKGERGLCGERGECGERGYPGERGCRGLVGFTGPRGPQGPQGENGINGLNGLNGPQGPAGTTSGTVAAQYIWAASQAAAAQTVFVGEKVRFNTLGYNVGITASPALPNDATDFILPAGPSLYLVTYGVSISPDSTSAASLSLNLIDTPSQLPVAGSRLGVASLTTAYSMSSITSFVATQGPAPSLSIINSNVGQLGPALLAAPNGESVAYISITQLW